ncbi:hypothetical protein AVEN_181652-1, partial [Araneus ventricosus]
MEDSTRIVSLKLQYIHYQKEEIPSTFEGFHSRALASVTPFEEAHQTQILVSHHFLKSFTRRTHPNCKPEILISGV